MSQRREFRTTNNWQNIGPARESSKLLGRVTLERSVGWRLRLFYLESKKKMEG